MLSLDCVDKLSLALFLDFHFRKLLKFTATASAEYTGIMMGKSEKTMNDSYFNNSAEIVISEGVCSGLAKN